MGTLATEELEPTPAETAPTPDENKELPALSKYEVDLLRQIVARGERVPVQASSDRVSLGVTPEPLTARNIDDQLEATLQILIDCGYITALDKSRGLYQATDKGKMISAGNPEIKTEDK